MSRGRLDAQAAMGVARSFRRVSTSAEAALWKALRGRRLVGLKFRRQHPVDGFIVDFYCAERRLIVEVDGSVHDRQRAADEERQAMLDASGYRVVRLHNDTVLHDPATALAAIRAAAQYSRSPSAAETRVAECETNHVSQQHTTPSPHGGEGAGG